MGKMKSPIGLIVRCYAFQQGGQWQAFTLEFGLAAQADSWPAVRQKLDVMIKDYLYDALVGEDREHAFDLLNRRAVAGVYVGYHFAAFMQWARSTLKKSRGSMRTFNEPMPLVPPGCHV